MPNRFDIAVGLTPIAATAAAADAGLTAIDALFSGGRKVWGGGGGGGGD